MRWRIHGSDASSGNAVLLDVEADDAVAAVAHAHGRDIIVSRVARAGRERLRKAAPFLIIVTAITLGLATAVLDHQLTQTRRALEDASHSSGVSLADLQSARAQLADAQSRLATIEVAATQQQRDLGASILDLKNRLAASESAAQQLHASVQTSHGQIDTLASQLTSLKRDLATAESARKSLELTLADSRKLADKNAADAKSAATRAKQAESRVTALDSRLADLAAKLKAAEAQSQQLQSQLDQTRAEKPVETPRHALALSYDDAVDFVSLNVGKPTIESSRGMTRVTAAHIERANTFSLTTDKERIFDATFFVCLAPDAPKEALAENRDTLAKFAATFAPNWKSPLPWLDAQFKHLAGKAESEHSLLTTEHYRITVTPNKLGQFAVRIEPRSPDSP